MSLVHWLVVALVIVLIFGTGRLPRVMNDLAEGIKAFKKGMKDDPKSPAARIEDKAADTIENDKTKIN